ncbi:MAG: DUF3892 domain-containing protein [Caulobacterales bacterium]
MANRRITCINKTDRFNPWERIRKVGGPWGSTTQEQAIRDIDAGLHSYFVQRAGVEVGVIVAISPYGNRYLKTRPDGEQPNNLLELPECA